MRVLLQKSIGLVLGMQSDAVEGTLIANAAMEFPGIATGDLEERVVDAAGYAALLAAQPVSLEDALLAKRAAIDRAFAAAVAAGLAYGGKVVQLDDASRREMSGLAALALAIAGGQIPEPWSASTAWRTADNSPLVLTTPADMLALGYAVAVRYQAIFWHRAALRDAVAAAADVAAVDAVDASSGWPA